MGVWLSPEQTEISEILGYLLKSPVREPLFFYCISPLWAAQDIQFSLGTGQKGKILETALGAVRIVVENIKGCILLDEKMPMENEQLKLLVLKNFHLYSQRKNIPRIVEYAR